MEKQIKRAEKAIQEPAKIKRMKFLRNNGNNNYSINQELIKKQKILLGIKGYYTNLPPHIKDNIIIKQYHNPWHVEQAFRVAKSDLEMRPIYHFKQQAVKVHVLICFMALVISRFMEIKTGLSLKQIIKNLKSVTDAIILNTLTGEEYILQSEISAKTNTILKKTNL